MFTSLILIFTSVIFSRMKFEISTNFILDSPLSIKIVFEVSLWSKTLVINSFGVNLLMKFIRLAKVIGGLFVLLLNKLNLLLIGLEFSTYLF
jgi:hypothetical protein